MRGLPSTITTRRGDSARTFAPIELNSASGTSMSVDAACGEPLVKRHRHQRRVDDGQVVVHRAENRHQVEDVARPAPVRERNDDELVDGVGEQGAQLTDAVVVRAVAAADNNGAIVEPHDVAAFESAGRFDAADDGDAPARECRALRCGLAGAQRFAHRTQDDAALADDRRVAHVDRIEADTLTWRQREYLSARLLQQREKLCSYSSSAAA